MTLSEVLPKPVETGNDELAEKFKTYLKNGPNLILFPIGETIGETAGVLRGKYPYLKTVDAIQIATALDAEADAFLTNDKKLSGIKEIKILVLTAIFATLVRVQPRRAPYREANSNKLTITGW